MARKLYVGNLPYEAVEQDLQTLFASAGSVESVNVIRDMATGRARGFAFVEMVTDAALLLVAALVVILVRTPRRRMAVPCEIAAVTVLAILLSPIAWDHYWTMMFPAFLILYDGRDERLLGRAGPYAFWTAALLITGLSRLTLGKAGFSLARELSVNTLAALILYLSLIVMCGKLTEDNTRTTDGTK